MDIPKCQDCLFPSLFFCSCNSTLCHSHVTDHISSPGSHKVTQRYSGPENLICQTCNLTEVSFICNCSGVISMFCDRCNQQHEGKERERGRNHVSLPIEYFAMLKSGFRFEELVANYKRTEESVQQAKAALLSIDQFSLSFDRECQRLIAAIEAMRRAITEELAETRAKAESEFNLVRFELENHSQKKEYQSQIPLVNALRGTNSSNISLFTHSDVSMTEFVPVLRNSIKFNYVSVKDVHVSAMEVGFLPLIRGAMMTKFILPEISPELSVLTNLSIDDATTYCFSTPQTLYCIGGHNSQRVCEISIPNERVTDCPEMSKIRALAGVCIADTELLVFGGSSSIVTLNSCEAMDLGRKHWQPLVNMDFKRCGFNPVRRNNGIYLIGGEGANGRIERFDIRARSIARLEAALPLNKFTTSFLVNTDILILQNNYRIVLHLNESIETVSQTDKDTLRWSPIVVCWEGHYYYLRRTVADRSEIYKLAITALCPVKVLEVNS